MSHDECAFLAKSIGDSIVLPVKLLLRTGAVFGHKSCTGGMRSRYQDANDRSGPGGRRLWAACAKAAVAAIATIQVVFT
jgi:hypothetical protein